MQIQFNSGHNIDGDEKLAAHVTETVRDALVGLADHITRVEVHISDQGRHRQPDIRCMMEARLEGRQPLAVSHQSGSIHQAVTGACRKIERVVTSALRPGSARA